MRPYPVFAFAAVLALSACGQPTETEQQPPPQAEPPEQAMPPQAEAPEPVTAEDQAAIGDGFQVQEVQQVQEPRAASSCDPTAQGSVNLALTGQPGDSFRVILMCGQTVVARCTAEVPPGAQAGQCGDGPHPQPAGPRRCFYGPNNANSAAATVGAWGCT